MPSAMLNVCPYDGNRDRWMSVERSLALSSFICRELGQTERGEVYDQLLQAPDTVETDPFKAGIAAKVRQRGSTNRTCTTRKSSAPSTTATETPSANGGCSGSKPCCSYAQAAANTLGVGELDHRIANELEAVRS